MNGFNGYRDKYVCVQMTNSIQSAIHPHAVLMIKCHNDKLGINSKN